MRCLRLILAILGLLCFSSLEAGNTLDITVYRMMKIQRAYSSYFRYRGHFPLNTTGIIDQPLNEAQSSFMEPLSPIDGWGNKLSYSTQSPSQSYRLISWGANGQLDSSFPEPNDLAALLRLEEQKFEPPSTTMPLIDLIRFWADISGNNIVVDRFRLQGEVIIGPHKQPWTDVLSCILADCGLGVAKYGDVTWIAPAEKAKYLNGLPKKTYTGESFSFDFMNIDLYDLLRFIGDVAGLKAVVDPTIKGDVGMKLTEMPWDEALDILSRYYGLKYTITDKILRIERLKGDGSSPLTRNYDDIVLTQLKWGYCLVEPNTQ